MALVTQNSGCILLLEWSLQSTSTPENLKVKLFTNNILPSVTDTAGTYTETAFSGYASSTLSRATWGTPVTTNGVASSTYGSPLTWTCSGTGATLYGYFVVGATSGTLIYSEAFDTPRIVTNGDQVTLTPVLTLGNA